MSHGIVSLAQISFGEPTTAVAVESLLIVLLLLLLFARMGGVLVVDSNGGFVDEDTTDCCWCWCVEEDTWHSLWPDVFVVVVCSGCNFPSAAEPLDARKILTL